MNTWLQKYWESLHINSWGWFLPWTLWCIPPPPEKKLKTKTPQPPIFSEVFCFKTSHPSHPTRGGPPVVWKHEDVFGFRINKTTTERTTEKATSGRTPRSSVPYQISGMPYCEKLQASVVSLSERNCCWFFYRSPQQKKGGKTTKKRVEKIWLVI